MEYEDGFDYIYTAPVDNSKMFANGMNVYSFEATNQETNQVDTLWYCVDFYYLDLKETSNLSVNGTYIIKNGKYVENDENIDYAGVYIDKETGYYGAIYREQNNSLDLLLSGVEVYYSDMGNNFNMSLDSGSSVNVTSENTTNGVILKSTLKNTNEDYTIIKLTTNKITSGEEYNTVNKLLKDKVEKFVGYNATIESNEVALKLNEKVKLSIPIPSDYDTSKLLAYKLSADKTLTKLEVNIEKVNNIEYAVFETEDLGTYVLAEEKTIEVIELSGKKVEKNGFIIYNPYFNTTDMTDISYKEFENTIEIGLTKKNIDLTTFNSMEKELKNGIETQFLMEISNDVVEVNIGEWAENINYNEKAEIIEKDGKRYAVFPYTMYNEMGVTGIDMYSYPQTYIKLVKKEKSEEKQVYISFELYSTNHFRYSVDIVNEKGVIYASSGWHNGVIMGVGVEPIPKNLNFSKSYAEFFVSEYLGTSIEVENLGTVPYIGKYGEEYKYKTSLKNANVHSDGLLKLHLGDIKGMVDNDNAAAAFFLDENYTINNEITFEAQTQTNTETELKFDLQGNFSGSVEVTEVAENDFIYSKVEEELTKKSNSDYVYMSISNIYIVEGGYEGKLKLTFNVGEEYNNKYYYVAHMKDYNYEFETFEGIVKNGKIEITVDSLSPFGIAIADTNTSNNDNKLDNTPETGKLELVNIISLIAIISLVGIVVLNRKK